VISSFSGLAWSLVFLGVFWALGRGITGVLARRGLLAAADRAPSVRLALGAHLLVYNLVFLFHGLPVLRAMRPLAEAVQARGGCVLVDPRIFWVPLVPAFLAWGLILGLGVLHRRGKVPSTAPGAASSRPR